MTRIHPEDPAVPTPTTQITEQLRQLIPEAFADGEFNPSVLSQLLAEEGTETVSSTQREVFGLNWTGKAAVRRLAMQKPKGSALKPVPGEGVDEDTTQNIFIEGDNLEVLKLLREAYADSVKMIYIDPPYNTGKDFIYKDDFSETIDAYLRRTGEKEGDQLLVSNPKSNGRFHSNWLNFMYPRLRVAKDLLAPSGAIFISINDIEVSHLRIIMNEIFGEENFASCIVWQKSKKGDSKLIAVTHEYVLVYTKDKAKAIEAGKWSKKKNGVDEVLVQYDKFQKLHKDDHTAIRQAMMKWYNQLKEDDPRISHKHYNHSDKEGLYFPDNFAGPDDGRTSRPRYEIIHPVTGKPCKKPSTGWRWEEDTTLASLALDTPGIHFGEDETTIPCRKSYLKNVKNEPFASVFYRDGRAATLQVEELVGEGVFEFPKNTDVLQDFLEVIQDKDSIVIDFFGGSGSTAHAVFDQNLVDGGTRKFVVVQIPERTKLTKYPTISEVTKERIRQASSKLKNDSTSIDFGFKVFKLDTSTFRPWKDFQGTNIPQLEMAFSQAAKSPLVDDWKFDDLMTEIMLLEGFPLHSRIVSLPDYEHNKLVEISSDFCMHKLLICLDKKLHADTVTELQVPKDDIFICLDTALSDQAKVTLNDRCKIKTI